jgi:hypothetical protein
MYVCVGGWVGVGGDDFDYYFRLFFCIYGYERKRDNMF